jgi:hypothetical protein
MPSPDLDAMFGADAAEAIARRRDDTHLAVARQRDGAAYDLRMLGGFMTASLFASDDPERFAGMNAGVRVPTTVDHPGNPVAKTA